MFGSMFGQSTIGMRRIRTQRTGAGARSTVGATAWAFAGEGARAMKDLAKLLKKRHKPSGPAPQEWLFATKLPVSSGSLFIGDPYYDAADAYVATVPPGTYRIEAR